jgi:phosphoglycolate phosphatase
MNRLAIFDCDGTLVDSQANICLAMEHCFAAAGLEPPPRERTRQVVGLSLVEAMRAMLPEAGPDRHVELAHLYRDAFHALRRGGLADEPLYEGVAALIDGLEEEGWLLGVATGKSDRGLACASRITASTRGSSRSRRPIATRPSPTRRWCTRPLPRPARRRTGRS